MTGLVDRYGNPLSSANFARPKKDTSADPIISSGEIAPGWNVERKRYGYTIPFGGTLAFDTSKLTLSDYRAMRDHYQVNSSFGILSFMIHQMDWRVAGDRKDIATRVEDNLRDIWPSLVRSMSQAFWAGFAPNATQWENDGANGKVTLTKIKDLPPEECEVKWKQVPAAGDTGNGGVSNRTPIDQPQEGTLIQIREKLGGNHKGTAKIFDGIIQHGYPNIPVGNSFWYPMQMEYGNYYGKKLLNTAYQSWFFSLLIHMYSNRYFERFGEPTPIARAPYDEEIDVNGQSVKGHKLMQTLARQFRSGAAVVLPNNRVMNGTEDTNMFEYDMEFLESQMRGADFDRYLQRLDEEIALSLFTPILLNRTGSGGSFNLGVTHMQLFQWQVNAIVSDMVQYINKYIISPMVRLNFPGYKGPLPRMVFRSQGRTDPETLRAVVLEVVRAGAAKPDLVELGDALGLKLEEIEQIIEPPQEPGNDPNNPQPEDKPVDDKPGGPRNGNTKTPDERSGRPERSRAPKGSEKRGKLAAGMADRVRQQFMAGNAEPDVGYWSQWRNLLLDNFGVEDAGIIESAYDRTVRNIDRAYSSLRGAGIADPEIVMGVIKDTVEENLQGVISNDSYVESKA
ncbi:portal protein [Gordonia phage Jumbo]|uniref:Portal protein n=1 Tax=Gordonia phage Jumbo TaxID=1887650 RepID=A0A1B3B0J7_9CAUD|nr:portal protein [Gordonia phage Jumbo]AOE44522.1 portal protein [Gordonia phage Jumbo]